MNTPKYDYSNFILPSQLHRKNGIYILYNEDKTKLYIGKTDDKDNGFRQRYGTYLHNQAYNKSVGSGNKLFQSDKKVYMDWLYVCEPTEYDSVKELENCFIRYFRCLHPDKLVNQDIKGSRYVDNKTFLKYIKGRTDQINMPLLLEFEIFRPYN